MPSELVRWDWTNAPLESKIFNELILLFYNNINEKKDGERAAQIVQRVWTILSNRVGGDVARYIFDKVVFTVAAIPRNEGIAKATVYQVVKELRELQIVEKTLFKAQNPDPTYTGPKAAFFKIRGFDLSDGWSNPRLKEAQLDYEASFLPNPEHVVKQSKRNRLLEISLKLVDYYESRGSRPLNHDSIIDIIKHRFPEVEPQDRQQVAKLFAAQFFHREEDP